jgi:hypothetical protein
MFVILFLVQCNPPLVGKHPLFADFRLHYTQIPLSIKVEVIMRSKQISAPPSEWQSLLPGVVLILTGLLILAIAAYGLLSLDRVRDLWPAAIILVGLADLLTESPSAERGQHE